MWKIDRKYKKAVRALDLQFGLEKEVEELEKIRRKFGSDVKKTGNAYYTVDYEGDNCYVELKSRRNSFGEYPSAMIGLNKLEFADYKATKPVYFVFSYYDGLYFWKFDREEVGKGVDIRMGGRCDRGMNEFKKYGFISNELLEKIE